jgi:AraC-like DNA-binding protein
MPREALPQEPPSWDFPRVPIAARMIVEAGRARGVATSDLLRGTALSLEDLADSDRLIEADLELAIARNLITTVGDRPGLGVDAVRNYTIGSVGILGFALLTSPTVRDAIEVCGRYLVLTSAFFRFGIETVGEEVRIAFDDDEIPDDVRAFLVERDMAAILQLMPLLFGAELLAALARVELRMPRERASALAALLPTPNIRFGMPRNLVALPRLVLDLPMPQADPLTAQLCERQCRDLLDRRQHRHGTAATVRARLLRTPSDPPSMQAVANDLNLDSRTLRRRLDAEGTSFRGLVAEVRETLAIELLANTGLTVEEVAVRLGYADPASFTHAFTRWRGKPPSSYRHASRIARRG